jgi:hypothetical protein
MEIDDFVLENIFYKSFYNDNEHYVWWRECWAEGAGYIVIWPNGEHLHAYHYPPTFTEGRDY